MKTDHFFNRELSWLSFNERVLEEAAKETLPALERAKFLAITASNLDEFFMVRVGGLQFMKDANKRVRDLAGLTPTQQLAQIREEALHFIDRQYAILNGQLRPLLQDKGIRRMMPDELTPAQRTRLHEYFNEQIFPVLSPIAVEPEEGRISLPALHILLMSEVRCRAQESEEETVRHVVFTLPPSLSRHVVLADVEGPTHAYMNVEDLVEMFVHQYFPQEQVHGTARFRISRNSDITLDDESAQDLAAEMEQILEARKSSSTIRLEIEEEADVTPALVKAIQKLCDVTSLQTYMIPGELDLRSCFALAGLPGFETLKVTPW
ncbi:MAG TPA: polyphosphate kinase 1, partial [Verrucomicrobium sp.]|nr:polyphosphate kinase 1 [Verrucomicrobium sp.]